MKMRSHSEIDRNDFLKTLKYQTGSIFSGIPVSYVMILLADESLQGAANYYERAKHVYTSSNSIVNNEPYFLNQMVLNNAGKALDAYKPKSHWVAIKILNNLEECNRGRAGYLPAIRTIHAKVSESKEDELGYILELINSRKLANQLLTHKDATPAEVSDLIHFIDMVKTNLANVLTPSSESVNTLITKWVYSELISTDPNMYNDIIKAVFKIGR